MDEQEHTTSTKEEGTNSQRNFDEIFKTIFTSLFSAIVLSACYLLVPLGVIWVAAKMPTSIGWIATILSVPAIWFVPSVIAIVATTMIEFVVGQDDEDVERGWFLGIIVGSVMLTAVWLLPLLEGLWPSFGRIFQPLRIAALFDDTLLVGLSWLVSVPMMTYANLSGLTDTSPDSYSSQTKEEQRSQSGTQSVNSPTSMNGTDGQDRKALQNDDLQRNRRYQWEPAPETWFADIGGMESLKTNIERSVLRPLTRIDEAYERFNVSPPNGILLYGPPGTGKTLFARAIAGELGHPYLELSAGDIKSRWINESTEQVNQLFAEAEQFDRCVIFIDEIDALLAGRGNDLHREHAQVVNEFLTHLDDENPNYLVIAATNRADLLDEAATRRGRFDQQYEIGLPDDDAREAIFRVRLRELPTALDEDDYHELAERSEGLSSADVVGIVDDAAMHAAERDAEAITLEDIHEAFPDRSTGKDT
ncbi:ATP-binding protein [Natronosalvus halobius]|uniref:ATP-binding protein n=1 Tax=Natronosalvus halobius TaxID=2953746 RepID=UPI00209F59F6|nr:ATP-binding protein [Natronosalvus halobius]USZ73550.1 ATP-binding protein [Natronosalvus halobius]